MKRIIKGGGLLLAMAVPALHAQVINFHYAHNYAAGGSAGYADIVYSGQGAYSDPGHDIWNGFGSGFSADTGPNLTSSGSASSVTFSAVYGGANGGLWFDGPDGSGGNTHQGTPFFLLGYGALVNAGNPGAGTSGNPMGTFTLSGVAAGTYNLFLYGVNYDGDRGSTFSLSSGTAHLGIDSTTPTGTQSTSLTTFGEGLNYVEFDGVTPDAFGNITGSWIYNSGAPNVSGLEGPFNGLQLVAVPEPSMLALLGLGASSLLCYRRHGK